MPASSDISGAAGTVGRAIGLVLNILAIIASLAVTGLMFFLVVARYVLGLSVVGLHELIMLAAVALYMIGAMIASRNRDHLTVDWLASLITTPRAKAGYDLLIATITVVITIFFMVWAYRMFAWGLVRPQVTPGYQIPLWVPQAAIGVASIGCFCYGLRDVIDAAFRLRRN